MRRMLWLDAALLSAGITFILFLVATVVRALILA